MSLSPQLENTPPDQGQNQPHVEPPESSPSTVTGLIAEIEPEEPEVNEPEEEPIPLDELPPSPDDDDIDDDRLQRALDKRGVTPLNNADLLALLQVAAGQTQSPKPTGEAPEPEEDDDDLAYVLATNSQEGVRRITERATRDFNEQQRLVNQMVREVKAEVPEIDTETLEMVREKLQSATLAKLKEIKGLNGHVGSAKMWAYDNLKGKTPVKKATTPTSPKAPARPDRTNMAPAPEKTAKDMQKAGFEAALSKVLRKEVKLNVGN